MKKPDSLRALLRTAIPQLKRDPDKLHIFLDEGNIIATAANSLSFEYQYILNAIVTDYEGHPDTLMVPILGWLKINQPEMMLNRDKMREGFTFEAEILNTKTADLSIKLRLTERVAVTDDPATGQRTIKHLDEPVLDPYAEVEKWELIIHGEVVQTT
ncbi:phage tail protein [Pseudomonas laurylsulfatiphila]|uniref:phage tail protein n=1 Tax=Pseudomonas laurylsulfatiphila TaxID=2011015 RepID=UPI003D19B235